MDALFLYKLIILYMLDRIDEYTLTNTQITSFILDHNYTTIFNIHESLSEMISSGFISVNTIRDTQHYKITNLGGSSAVSGESSSQHHQAGHSGLLQEREDQSEECFRDLCRLLSQR